jgi:hypothetical protein
MGRERGDHKHGEGEHKAWGGGALSKFYLTPRHWGDVMKYLVMDTDYLSSLGLIQIPFPPHDTHNELLMRCEGV